MRKFVFFALVLVAAIAFGLSTCVENQKKKIAALEKHIEWLQTETVPLKFKIVEKKQGEIRVALKFLDMEGTEIAKKEYQLEGKELLFDFFVVKAGEKYLAFPFALFTEKIAPKNGIRIVEEYDKQGFPQIFHQKELSKEARQALEGVYAEVKTDAWESENSTFGNLVHDLQGIKEFKPGVVYKIVSRTKGGLEVLQD